MHYLGQFDENYPQMDEDLDTGNLNQALSQFQAGDIAGAAVTLGLTGAVTTGLITATTATGIGAVVAVGYALTKLIGRGRREADIIVPVQNQLINPQQTGQLDYVTQILTRNPPISTLQTLYNGVAEIGQKFHEFVTSSAFNDGRASQQALNTIMPYIDGTCGYQWPNMVPSQRNCLRWGDGTPGGSGTDGILGAIARAILRQGGAIPSPVVTQGYGANYPTLQTQGYQSYPYTVQSGTIPNTAPLSRLQPQTVPTIGAGIGPLPLLLLGGAALFFMTGRGKAHA